MAEPRPLAEMFTPSEIDLLIRAAVNATTDDADRRPLTNVQWNLARRAAHYATSVPPVDSDEDAGPVVVLVGNGYRIRSRRPRSQHYRDSRVLAPPTATTGMRVRGRGRPLPRGSSN